MSPRRGTVKQIKPLAPGRLAPYAAQAAETRGRLYPEAPSKTRGPFERDRDRIIHSRAFRRLKFKTQVFVYHEGDHYRTRLSHSIEVAQVARSLARLLWADEDLAETCALAHDLGHTPFAHVGEDALKECMAPYGGFSHNDQTLRVVTLLEKKYPHFDGLNLSWESLEGLVKHGGPVARKAGKTLDVTLTALSQEMDLMLSAHAGLEAQIAGLADDIAYNSHDLDDGFAAGLFTVKDLAAVPWVDAIVHAKRKAYPGLEDDVLMQETVRDVMGLYIQDALAETRCRLSALKPRAADDIRRAKTMTVALSDAMRKKDSVLRDFLWSNFYLHGDVARVRLKTARIVSDLFGAFMDNPRCLPRDWQARANRPPKGADAEGWRARTVADCIASMTDRLAILEHEALFDARQVLR